MVKFIVHFICQLARGCLPVAAHAAVGISAHSLWLRLGDILGGKIDLVVKDFSQKRASL
jgi:hypothetical protein